MRTKLIHTNIRDFKEVYATHDQQNERLVIAGVHYDKSIVLDTSNIDLSIERRLLYDSKKDDLKKVIDIVIDEMELCLAST